MNKTPEELRNVFWAMDSMRGGLFASNMIQSRKLCLVKI